MLGDQAAISLLAYLYPLPVLREASLSGNHLGDIFLSALDLTQFKSKTLRLLDISQNTFIDGKLLVNLIDYADTAISCSVSGVAIDIEGSFRNP